MVNPGEWSLALGPSDLVWIAVKRKRLRDKKIYHGVELIIGDFNDRSRREYGPSRMIYSERKIKIDPIVNT